MFELPKHGKVLVVNAHHDDAEIGIGGSLVRLINDGHHVRVVTLTCSPYVQWDGKHRQAEALLQDAQSVADFLGYELADISSKVVRHRSTMPPYPEDVPEGNHVVHAIEEELRDLKPHVVLTMYSQASSIGHRNTARAAIAAARRHPRVLSWEPMFPDSPLEPFEPNYYVDLGGFLPKKLEAIRLHKGEYTKFGEELVKAVEARATLRGYEAQTQYAEAFKVVKWVTT